MTFSGVWLVFLSSCCAQVDVVFSRVLASHVTQLICTLHCPLQSPSLPSPALQPLSSSFFPVSFLSFIPFPYSGFDPPLLCLCHGAEVKAIPSPPLSSLPPPTTPSHFLQALQLCSHYPPSLFTISLKKNKRYNPYFGDPFLITS